MAKQTFSVTIFKDEMIQHDLTTGSYEQAKEFLDLHYEPPVKKLVARDGLTVRHERTNRGYVLISKGDDLNYCLVKSEFDLLFEEVEE
jgi:hypothetical protein